MPLCGRCDRCDRCELELEKQQKKLKRRDDKQSEIIALFSLGPGILV